jgi:putative SOS response-associated peptidase YedK
MCGRYSLSGADGRALQARFALDEPPSLRPRYNIAPGTEILTVHAQPGGRRHVEALRWGLVPHWASSPRVGQRMINARAETLRERPAYRGPLARCRCLIPADGFYEWQPRAGGQGKQAHHIARADRALFAFAGLCSTWHQGQPDELRSVTIVTTAAGTKLAQVHDRMPVILRPADEELWLAPETPAGVLDGLLAGADDDDLVLWPVGPEVGDPRHDGPDCLRECGA